MSTYSSINRKYKTRNKVMLVGYSPCFLELDLGRFLSISFTILCFVLLTATALWWYAMLVVVVRWTKLMY